MRLLDFEIFTQVVEQGGMTQAASLRGVSQPGISRTIRDLETRLQATLLRRTGRGVELTPAGERFYEFARDTLSSWEETEKQVHDLAGNLGSELSIAVPMKTGRLMIPALHKSFATALPALNVHIYEDTSVRMVDGLRAKTYDIALMYSEAVIAIEAETLFTEQLYVVGQEHMLGSTDQPIALNDVATMPLLLPNDTPFRRLIDQAFRSIGLETNVVRSLETSEGMLAFATEGEGVCILSYSNIYRECALGEVTARPITSPAIERGLCLAVGPHAEHRLANAASRVTRETLKALARQARWRPTGTQAY